MTEKKRIKDVPIRFQDLFFIVLKHCKIFSFIPLYDTMDDGMKYMHDAYFEEDQDNFPIGIASKRFNEIIKFIKDNFPNQWEQYDALRFFYYELNNFDSETEKKYKMGYEWKLSQDGWDHIREEEGLKLKAYKIGDGKITVGYGHAEPIKDSKFKVGETITKEKAEELLKQDIKIAADGVRRMFKDWEKDNTDIKITQSMFDALVSIAYNVGVGGLRRSDLVNKLKRGEYEQAGDSILHFKTSKRFPGLAKRRQASKKGNEIKYQATPSGNPNDSLSTPTLSRTKTKTITNTNTNIEIEDKDKDISKVFSKVFDE
jgi:lysozyme